MNIAVEPTASRAKTVERFLDAVQEGDYATLKEVLTPESLTRWPQSGEQVTGAVACIRVYENYPGGPPKYSVARIVGDGDLVVAELIGNYGAERWYVVSIYEFEGERIARMTDYFGPSLPAPEWRMEMVDPAG
jgi:limonene-1,2-epoxide hydrolase